MKKVLGRVTQVPLEVCRNNVRHCTKPVRVIGSMVKGRTGVCVYTQKTDKNRPRVGTFERKDKGKNYRRRRVKDIESEKASKAVCAGFRFDCQRTAFLRAYDPAICPDLLPLTPNHRPLHHHRHPGENSRER